MGYGGEFDQPLRPHVGLVWCSHRRWWIIGSASANPFRGRFSSECSSYKPPYPRRRLLPTTLLARSSTFPRDEIAFTPGLRSSQAETGGKGYESTSHAVH